MLVSLSWLDGLPNANLTVLLGIALYEKSA